MDCRVFPDEAVPRGDRQSPLFIVVLWLTFFLISMGLGYSTLNRYDARNVPGLYDTRAYYAMVTDQPLQPDQVDLGHRVLVPFLARPIYHLAKDRIHTWNAASFALLTVNSLFTSITALLILLTGFQIAGAQRAAVLGSFVFLANFAVANLNLSGYVDSSVNCMLMAIVWSMIKSRWWLLPAFGVLGALSKETFVPMCVIMVFTWWLVDGGESNRRISRLIWIAAMTVATLASLRLVMAWAHPAELPLAFAASRRAESPGGYFGGLIRCLTAREFLFTFIWLLPLGVWRLKTLPKPWVAGAASAGTAALAMGAYDDALGNAARAMFSAVGPLLSLSAALLLSIPIQPEDQGIPRTREHG